MCWSAQCLAAVLWPPPRCGHYCRFSSRGNTTSPLLRVVQFSIAGRAVSVDVILNYEESPNSFDLRIAASDGQLSTTVHFLMRVTVVDRNDQPVISSAASASTREKSPVGTVVYTMSFTDQDPKDGHTFSLTTTGSPFLVPNSKGTHVAWVDTPPATPVWSVHLGPRVQLCL